MIKINLLPPELQGKKGQRRKPAGRAGAGPPSPVLGAMLTVLLLLVVVGAWGYVGYYGVWNKIETAKKEAAQEKKKHDALEKDLKAMRVKHAAKLARWELMQNQREILQELKPDQRILWSEKLNMLSNLVPKDVFITEIEVLEDQEMVETETSKKKRQEWADAKKEIEGAILDRPETARRLRQLGPEPKVVQKPIITQTLVIQAVTLVREGEPADRINKAIEFQRNMQNYSMSNAKNEERHFRDFFEKDPDSMSDVPRLKITPGPMAESELDGVPVWSFEFSVVTERPEGAGPGKAAKKRPRRR